jgi:hypothetical protein
LPYPLISLAYFLLVYLSFDTGRPDAAANSAQQPFRYRTFDGLYDYYRYQAGFCALF